MNGHTKNNHGFTLIEMMIALCITSIVMAAVYAVNQSNIRAYSTQQQVVDMQQNARAMMYFLAGDLRMAGYDPTGGAEAGVESASAGQITVSMDLNEDGDLVDAGGVSDPGEVVTYALNGSDLERDNVSIGHNVDAFNMVYLDKDGGVLLDADGDGLVDEPLKIRSFEVSLVVRAGEKELALSQQFTDDKEYQNQRGQTIFDKTGAPDTFRRRLYTSGIWGRNLGL